MPNDRDEALKDSNEEKWEDVEEDEDDGPWPGKTMNPSHDDVEELSAKNSTLFM